MRTGNVGAGPTKPVQTSVPPLSDPICTCCADGVGDPREAFRRERGAGRAEVPQPAEVVVVAGPQTGLAACHHERCTHPEHVDLLVGGERPQRRQIGRTGITVEQHRGGADECGGREEVPHHPAGRREPAEPLAGAEVVVQRQRLHVFER